MQTLGPESTVTVTVHRETAGFWRRVLAFLIDAVLTAIPCGILGFTLYDFFTVHRADGILIGIALTLPYFAILGSSIGAGQTLGHRITDLQVVDQAGNPISLKRSALRYSVLLVPILLSSELAPALARFGMNAAVDWLLSVGEGAIVYLYVFNRSTHQSLHDLATKTYVVRVVPSGPVEPRRFWAWHWMIVAGAALVSFALSIGITKTISQSGPFPNLLAVQQRIFDSGKVQTVGVSVQKNWNNGETSTGLIVNIVWKRKPQNFEQSAAEIADIVLQADSQVSDRDFITIKFHDGFSIGFARFSYDRQVSHSPKDWRGKIQRRPQSSA